MGNRKPERERVRERKCELTSRGRGRKGALGAFVNINGEETA